MADGPLAAAAIFRPLLMFYSGVDNWLAEPRGGSISGVEVWVLWGLLQR